MGYLTTFRGLFGNVLEVFHNGKGLQPKDLLHALQSTIEERKKVLLDGVFVPNHFTVHLSRKDMAEIQPLLRSLIDQLTVKVGEWIAQKGYATLSGTIHVAVIESAEMAEDDVYIEAVMQERTAPNVRPGGNAPAVSSAAPVPASVPTTPTRPEPRSGGDRKTVIIADRKTVVMDKPLGKLVVVGGKEDGRSFTLKYGENTIGRGPGAQILLEDEPPFVSRVHCAFTTTPDKVVVNDLNSTNGILVNGKKTKEAVLSNHDTIQVGSYTLHFVAASETGALATMSAR